MEVIVTEYGVVCTCIGKEGGREYSPVQSSTVQYSNSTTDSLIRRVDLTSEQDRLRVEKRPDEARQDKGKKMWEVGEVVSSSAHVCTE